jgi:hypothetical protein
MRSSGLQGNGGANEKTERVQRGKMERGKTNERVIDRRW